MNPHARIPLRPDPDAANRAFVRSFTRAAVCSMRSTIDGTQTAETYARKAYPNDSDVPRLLRAAVAPHTTTDSASNLVAQSMALLDALMPVAASAALLRDMLKRLIPDATPTLHGMRACFRTWCGEHRPDAARETAEAALGHANGDKLERTYDRGTKLAKRRRLMEAWARFCAGAR
jgi:hypothetical protein